jgi:hypothetical protein
MQPEQDWAKEVLGERLYLLLFYARPPMSILEAVANDPAYR